MHPQNFLRFSRGFRKERRLKRLKKETRHLKTSEDLAKEKGLVTPGVGCVGALCLRSLAFPGAEPGKLGDIWRAVPTSRCASAAGAVRGEDTLRDNDCETS